MPSLAEAVALIPRSLHVVKIGTSTESLRTEGAVLRLCEGLRMNLERSGLAFASKFSLYFATRDAAKQYIHAQFTVKPSPVFIIVDDFDSTTLDTELAQKISGVLYFTGFLLLNSAESALRARCAAFVGAICKVWTMENEKVEKNKERATSCVKCGVSGQSCKCIVSLIEKIQKKHVCGYDDLGVELYTLISQHIASKVEKSESRIGSYSLEKIEKEISKVSIKTAENDELIQKSAADLPSHCAPMATSSTSKKPVAKSSSKSSSVSSSAPKSYKSISSTVFQAGPNIEDMLKAVHGQSWSIAGLSKAFDHNCRQAQNLFGSKKPGSQVETMVKINTMIRNGIKSDRDNEDEESTKCWAIVLVYHAKLLRLMLTIGNNSVDLCRAVRHPRLYRAIRYALENPEKYTPNETVHTLIGDILNSFEVAIREHELEEFLTEAFLKLHRVAVILAIVYLSHQLAKCAGTRGLECHDVESEDDLRQLIAVAKAALTADEKSIAEKTGEFFSTWQTMICARLPELKDYKLVHFSFRPDLAMSF